MRTELPAERLNRRTQVPGLHLHSDSADTAGDAAARHLDDPLDPGELDEDDDGRATSLSRWLPSAQDDAGPRWLTAARADPGRAGVIGLAAVGVIAVLVTVFAVLGDEPPPVASVKLPPVEMSSSAGPNTPAAEQPVVVSVVGLVHKPGLVTLSPGARIADALTAAGGALGGADLVGLNIAQRVTDGQQIVVGIAPAPGQSATLGSGVSPSSATTAGSAPASPGAPAGLVDLNSATVEQLDALPGVGPVTAAAIVAWRDENGRFTGVDQLGDVDGIGPARLEKLRDLVRV